MEDNHCKGYLKGNANQHYRNFVCVDAEVNNKVKSLKYFLGFKVQSYLQSLFDSPIHSGIAFI